MYTLQLKDSNEKFYVVAIKHIMIIKLCCILGVKGTVSSSNNTIEVERVLGIEAARYVLIFINFSRLKCPDMMVFDELLEQIIVLKARLSKPGKSSNKIS